MFNEMDFVSTRAEEQRKARRMRLRAQVDVFHQRPPVIGVPREEAPQLRAGAGAVRDQAVDEDLRLRGRSVYPSSPPHTYA